MLANWIGAPMDEIRYTCAGINHLAWYLEFLWNNEDAIPKIREAITTNEDIYNAEQVRNEMFLAMGYYVTESSGHNSEYNWWFRKRPDLIEKHCTHGTHWNPGEYAYILNEYLRREDDWKSDITAWLENEEPLDLSRGHEYAAYIINAWLGGEPFQFNGNVPNTSLITNLPEGCCVEVPVFASKGALNPIQVGDLPAPVLPLTDMTAMIEEMAVEACLTGDPELVYQSIMYDPLTAAVLSLSEIRDMVKEMLEQNAEHLPTFGSVSF
jgi:alpha-galactosidase